MTAPSVGSRRRSTSPARFLGFLLACMVTLIVVSGLGVVLWQQYTRNASRRHLQEGLRAAHSGDVVRAIREFETAAELDSDNVDALYNLGLAYSDTRRNYEAVGTYLRALRLRPNASAIRLNLGNAYNRLGDRVRAIQEWKTALQLDERSVPARINLGIAATMDGQNDEALSFLTEASQLEPDNPGAHYNLGSLYMRLGQSERAESEFRRARQLRPDLPYLLFNLAKLYELRGDVALAISTYRQAIQERPEEAISHCGLSRLLLKGGNRSEDALRELETCRKELPQAAETKEMTEFVPSTGTKVAEQIKK